VSIALIGLSLLSPLVAIGVAVFSYVRHRRLIAPERRVPAFLYVFAAIACGAVSAAVGTFLGIDRACAGPAAGNLCGLVGFLVTRPIAGSLGVMLVALGLHLIRPAR
jgi:hypothetical protein